MAYAEGDWERTIALMAPVFEELVRIGGSRAQRDVFEQTLLSAYLHAGRDDEAAAHREVGAGTRVGGASISAGRNSSTRTPSSRSSMHGSHRASAWS